MYHAVGEHPIVLKLGILSNERAARVDHRSVALIEVQDRRDLKQVPGGLNLHQYANLYFHARNPMMYRRKESAFEICVLRVSIEVLKIEGVVITDRNASSEWVRFLHPRQIGLLDFDAIFAADWRHSDKIEHNKRKSKKCAEVLVPICVSPRFLSGAYVASSSVAGKLQTEGFDRPITVDADMFFH